LYEPPATATAVVYPESGKKSLPFSENSITTSMEF